MLFTVFSENWGELLHAQFIICFLKDLAWDVDFHWNNVKFVMCSLCWVFIIYLSTKLAMPWQSFEMKLWDYFNLKLKAKSGGFANGAKRNYVLQCHKNINCSQKSDYRYFKIGAKMDCLLPETGRTVFTFSQHSEDKVVLMLQENTVFQIPLLASSSLGRLNRKVHSHMEVLVWVETAWLKYHGKNHS